MRVNKPARLPEYFRVREIADNTTRCEKCGFTSDNGGRVLQISAKRAKGYDRSINVHRLCLAKLIDAATTFT